MWRRAAKADVVLLRDSAFSNGDVGLNVSDACVDMRAWRKKI